MLSRLVQPSNARYPLLVTLAGMLTLTRLLQPLNEYCPKLATPSEITTSFTCSRWEYQGTALELFQFAIAPVPLMVRTPSSLSSQVRFSPQVPLLAARGELAIPLAPLAQPKMLFCILFLAVLGSAVCFAMWNTVISRLGVVRANNYIYLQPFITIVASHFLLGEPMSWTAIVGALLIVGGVIISGRRAGEKP